MRFWKWFGQHLLHKSRPEIEIISNTQTEKIQVWLKQQKTPTFRLPQTLVSNHLWFQRAPLDFGWSVAVGLPQRWLIDLSLEDHVQAPLSKNQITRTHLRDLNLDSKYTKILRRHTDLESYTLRSLLLISSYTKTLKKPRLLLTKFSLKVPFGLLRKTPFYSFTMAPSNPNFLQGKITGNRIGNLIKQLS